MIGSAVIFDSHSFSTKRESTTIVTQPQKVQQALNQQSDYILVGGQNGTWFTKSQYPSLLQISISNHSVRQLDPVNGQGTVWSGSFNGSDWLVSGWGADIQSGSPNPY